MAWMNERFAPELLPHNDELVRRLRASVDEQTERIAELDPGAESMQRIVYEMEVERVMFLLRGYLRVRLGKVTKLALHLAKDEDAKACLSEQEAVFAGGYAKLYQEHIDREMWGAADTEALPEQLKTITQVEKLAAAPRLDAHVFCMAMRDCDAFTW